MNNNKIYDNLLDKQWYLSFDCATKSFAFSLLRIGDFKNLYEIVNEKSNIIESLSPYDLISILSILNELDEITSNYLYLAGGGAVDLVPNKPDKKIYTVERIRALQLYLRTTVADVLISNGCQCPENLNVVIEYQMGQNTIARTIMSVLVAEYSSANVFLVGPALKNKVQFAARPDLYHCNYLEKYIKPYDANKAHTKDIYFKFLSPLFNHTLVKKIPNKFYKDFADSVVQVLGFIMFGDLKNPDMHY